MKIVLDTDVILDLLMERQPFVEDAERIFAAVETGKVMGYLCGTTLTTIHYLIAKACGRERARQELGKILSLFEIAPVTRVVLEEALSAEFNDFEDAVLYRSGCHVGAQALITRNRKDFLKSSLPVYLPNEISGILATLPQALPN